MSVPILNDGIMEEPETFHFIAQADSSVRINVNTSAAQGTVVIDDNEGECNDGQISCTHTYYAC